MTVPHGESTITIYWYAAQQMIPPENVSGEIKQDSLSGIIS
jgi:hypothetical protein